MQTHFDPKDIGRLLRDRTTQHYFTGEGWTQDISQAQLFPNEDAAMRACITHHLQDVEVVVWMPATRTEVAATPAVRPT